ncbi:hypothetical protein [Variovorax sp. EL159]|uniref:hypothetical protein n=1 Tax=Variovorax sp. EL159 TaxID=1566270 RepID=UPI001C40940A|nr:hypothetical protein [Variovorax sp. EL159]
MLAIQSRANEASGDGLVAVHELGQHVTTRNALAGVISGMGVSVVLEAVTKPNTAEAHYNGIEGLNETVEIALTRLCESVNEVLGSLVQIAARATKLRVPAQA